jgi:ferredoxin
VSTVEIDADRCVGGGQCVLAAPELFDQDDLDGTVILLRQPEPEEYGDAVQAQRVCPARAIHVVP